jgi:pyruvate/2-oxoglutarate dehydrogenase complex dihydrolipoamide dehydrogenase (E3) component
VLTEAEVARVERSGAEYAVTAHVGSAQQTFTCDALLVAVGRAPNVDGLGLEAAGVRYDTRNGIAVDSYLATSSPRIYALGDVAGGLLFAHAAAAQAKIATRNALIPIRKRLDERVTPWATFTEPEVGRVGLTEAQARQAHGDAIWTTTLSMASVDRAATESATQGFIKLVATAGGRLLGATVVGEAAGEVINEVALAMTHGLTLAQLAATTHVYPTIALGLQQAAGQYTLRQTSQSGLVRLLRTLAR